MKHRCVLYNHIGFQPSSAPLHPSCYCQGSQHLLNKSSAEGAMGLMEEKHLSEMFQSNLQNLAGLGQHKPLSHTHVPGLWQGLCCLVPRHSGKPAFELTVNLVLALYNDARAWWFTWPIQTCRSCCLLWALFHCFIQRLKQRWQSLNLEQLQQPGVSICVCTFCKDDDQTKSRFPLNLAYFKPKKTLKLLLWNTLLHELVIVFTFYIGNSLPVFLVLAATQQEELLFGWGCFKALLHPCGGRDWFTFWQLFTSRKYCTATGSPRWKPGLLRAPAQESN